MSKTMAERKAGRSGCSLPDAADVFGGEEALRREAGHRAVYSMWKTRKAVPWGVVGPRLLEWWRVAQRVVPESQITDELERRVQEASEEHRRAMRRVEDAIRLVEQARRFRRFRARRAKSKT